MSFNPVRAPGVAEVNGQGNNLNTKVSSLRVMNDNPLTERQRMELEHLFGRHLQYLQTTIGGLNARSVKLSDGSDARFVSNSGLHQIMVWPVGRTVNLQEEPWFVFCIPADFQSSPLVAPFGWEAWGEETPVPGENGLQADSITDNVGALFRLQWKELDPGADLLLGKKLARYKPTYLPLLTNKSQFTDGQNNASAQRWEHREWVAPDMKTCITTYEQKISVNGHKFDFPAGVSDVLWCCIYFYEPSPGAGSKPHLFAVCITNGVVTARRRLLNDPTWATVATLDLSTLDPQAASSWGGLPDARLWVFKVLANASRTTCTLWVQNPSSMTAGSSSYWVGYVDIDMVLGTVTSTPATAESRHLTATYSYVQNGTNTIVTAWSGDRQISFTYEGDTKVITALRFSGAETQVVTTTSSSSARTETLDSWTDTRKVELVYGSTVVDTLWQNTIHSAAYSVTATDTTPAGTEHEAYWDGSRSSDITATRFRLAYYGGLGKTLAYFKAARRTSELHTWAATPFGSPLRREEDTQTKNAASDAMHIVVDGTSWNDVGERTYAGPSSSSTNGIGSAITWSDTGSNAAGYDITQSFWNVTGGSDLTTDDHMGNAHARYDDYDATDRSWMNTRRVRGPVGGDAGDFVIFSVPKPLTTVGTPHDGFPAFDSQNWLNYCTDPDILDTLNTPAPTGLLKGIRLK